MVHGRDLAELFANAGVGMFALMADLDAVEERQERSIQVEGRDLESLLVRWLTELLYYLDAEEMLFRRFQIDELTQKRLRARALGEPIDHRRHQLHGGIKAVTRHMLEIAQEDGGYRATILFDI